MRIRLQHGVVSACTAGIFRPWPWWRRAGDQNRVRADYHGQRVSVVGLALYSAQVLAQRGPPDMEPRSLAAAGFWLPSAYPLSWHWRCEFPAAFSCFRRHLHRGYRSALPGHARGDGLFSAGIARGVYPVQQIQITRLRTRPKRESPDCGLLPVKWTGPKRPKRIIKRPAFPEIPSEKAGRFFILRSFHVARSDMIQVSFLKKMSLRRRRAENCAQVRCRNGLF